MSEILVTGGTGHLGRELVPLLVTKGHNVKVFSRKPGPNHVVGDLITGDGVADAVKGIDVLVHCATAAADNGARGLSYELARKTDVEPLDRLIKLLDPKTHLVYISIVGVDQIPLGYYRTKLECEQLIERSGLPYTTLRTTQWHSLADEFCRRLASFPLVMAPRGVRMQLLDPSEVAVRMASLVEAGPSGRATDMGGPVALEFKDVAKIWARARKKKRVVVAAPFPGKAIKAFRAGYNLTLDHADGKITFEQWLDAN